MPRHPNILLVMCDQWRAASTGFAGDRTVQTPVLDGLVAQGTVLETAYCSSPVCSPARASWLTGLYPHGHGQLDNYGPGVSGTEPAAAPVLSEIRALERAPDESPERLAGTIMVRDGRWKYIRHRFDPCEELYDLQADTDEMTNLIETHPSRATDLRAEIAAVLRAHGAGPYAWAAGDR